jgi:hypothetical protein
MLGQKTSDLLFSLPLNEGRLGLFLLFEHLSNPQGNLPLRFHQYKGAAWAHQIKKGESPDRSFAWCCITAKKHGTLRERWPNGSN